MEGEYMTWRPLIQDKAAGFKVQMLERMRAGVVERLVAVRPVKPNE